MESCKNELSNNADMIALATGIDEFLTLVFQRLDARPLFLHKPVGQIVMYFWNLNCLCKGKEKGSGKHRSSNLPCYANLPV